MSPEIINVEQGSEEWFESRRGIPTASMFATVMAKGQGKTRTKYLYQLAGEILTGQPMDTFSNAHMEHGKEVEAEARAAYELLNDVEVQEVGFIRNGRKGASPDGLIGETGGLELKRKLPHLLIEIHKADAMPTEYRAQVQGGMWVAERDWWDFGAYYPGLPMFTKRVYRDEKYIANLAIEVSSFLDDLDEVVAFMKALGE